MKDFKDPVFLSGSHLDGPLDGAKWKADTEKEIKDDDGETYVFRRIGLSNQAVYCGTKAQCEATKATVAEIKTDVDKLLEALKTALNK